jgi:hypothetical protein
MNEPRPEIAAALEFLFDALHKEGIIFEIDGDEDNPNAFTIAAKDKHDYINSGIIGWSKEDKKVIYLAHDQARENHDLAEGIPLEQSTCWWDCKSKEVFLMNLTGEVRQIMREKIKKES